MRSFASEKRRWGLGIGGSSGGAGGGFMTARGTANFMTKLTAILGACFFLTSIILALLSSNNTPSIANEVEKSIEKSSTTEPTVPLDNSVSYTHLTLPTRLSV